MDNRALASQAFRDALVTDVYCVEAFQALTQHNILSAAEEKELLKSMPLKVIALFGCEFPRFLYAFDNLTF